MAKAAGETVFTRARQRLARALLAATGWSLAGPPPRARRYVLVAAPHTSNWDLPVMLALTTAMGIRVHWLGKHTLFRFPFKHFMQALGGISVDRSKHSGLVEAVAARLNDEDAFVVAIPPEGTRKYAPYWRSGFYRIAQTASVPIALGFLDYQRRVGGIGPLMHPSGDVVADMDKIRAFYRDKQAKVPERFAVPRLREEDARDELERRRRTLN